MNDFSDRELIEGLIEGDMNSFRKLFDEKYTLFYTFIKGMIKNTWLAEDITQNIFMKVWVNREKLNPNQSLHNYLFVLAKNEVRDHFKLKSNSYHQEIKENHRIFVEDFEGAIDVQVMRERVTNIVSKMPGQRKKVYELSREKMLSNKEIAEKLNLSVRTVERHLLLALQDIRKNLSLFYFFLFLNFDGLLICT